LGAPQQTEQKPDATTEYVDPEIASLKDEIKQLKGMVSKTSKTIEDRDRMTEQQHLDKAQADVDAFRDAKDEKGQLTNPHFEKLEQSMLALMKGGLAKTLGEAYKQASRLDPDIQALEEKAKADAKRASDATKAAAAKKAAASNRRGDSTPGKRSESLSITDSVREAFDEITAAV
jgi:septal ring factor EnvC (AmiA/AmiB activator)